MLLIELSYVYCMNDGALVMSNFDGCDALLYALDHCLLV